MRKRTISFTADTVFWYVLYFLPVIGYLLFMFIHPSGTNAVLPISFADYCATAGFGVVAENTLYTALYEIFGTGGIMPMFSSPTVFICMSWYVSMFMIHIFVDFVLLLPRLLHKMYDKVTKGD